MCSTQAWPLRNHGEQPGRARQTGFTFYGGTDRDRCELQFLPDTKVAEGKALSAIHSHIFTPLPGRLTTCDVAAEIADFNPYQGDARQK